MRDGLLVLLLLLFGGAELYGQDTSSVGYHMKYFGSNEGLPSRATHNSILDTTGVMWTGTLNGLCRIEGENVTVFDKFPQVFYGSMNRDANGFFYSVPNEFEDSVEVFDPSSLSVYGARFNDPGRGVFGGTVQRTGQPFFLLQGSIIYEYAPRADKLLRQVHLLKTETAVNDRLIHASEDEFLVYHEARNEIVHGVGNTVDHISLPAAQSWDKVYLDENGNIWVSGAAGTFRKPPGGSFVEMLSPQPDGSIINFFAEDRAGNIIFGYLDQVLYRVTYLEQIIDGVRSSANWILDIENRILSISGEDFRKTIRLNTFGGIYSLHFEDAPASPFRRYLYRDVLPGKFGDVMRGFAADDDGNVYVNKDSRMPYWFRVHPETGILDTVTMLRNNGEVVDHWGCGTNLLNYRGDIYGHSCDLGPHETFLGFVYRYRPADDSWKRWPLPDKHHVVRWVIEGREEGELLLITENKADQRKGKMYYFYPERDTVTTIRTIGPEYEINGNTKKVVFDARREGYWIGTSQGLYFFDPVTDELRNYVFNAGTSLFVSDVQIRENGKLIVSTLHEGIQEFDPKTGVFRKIGGFVPAGESVENAESFLNLPTDDVASLNQTKNGELLLTTFAGLILHGTNNGETTLFTTKDGLGDNEFNTTSTFYNPADERWYAGGINGFVSFSADDLKAPPSSYNPVILSYHLLDRNKGHETYHPLPSAPAEPLVLKPSVIYCAINFAIPDYSPRKTPLYQTKLDGLDPDWTAPAATSSVRYTGLKPGRYKLRVRAYDGEGRRARLERSLEILVLKPFYLQWWFILLSVLTVLAALYALHRRRMARLRDKLEDERKLLGLELRSLRLQLNPHFISNAMNAIKDVIKRPDSDDPSRYLTDFSVMMRSFLESSRHRFISIADEVDMLRRYVNLEQLRFPGKFEVEFYINEELKPEMDEVPTLMLQPIVENAIEHGLRPLTSGGKLRISFDLDAYDDDVIICSVSDNGVGRKMAAQTPKKAGHISRASAILEERRALLASDDEISLGVSVKDLHPEREHTGTVVTFRIEAG